MIYIISTLFSVLLGAVSAALVKVEYSSSPPGATANSLVTRHNLYRVAFAMALFLLDWIAFGIVYPPSKPFTATWFDVALFALYLPALVALTSSVMLSFGDGEEYCIPLAAYHCLAGLTDIVWLVWLAQTQSAASHSLVPIIICLSMYIGMRFAIPVMLFLSIKKLTSVRAEMLLLLGTIPKGFLFVMIPVTGISLPA
ncbi:MAG: hypothetical protein IPM03_06595 [Sulfuritalea sp.]|nr:hypothetical protein [Sulfuritalea sp.]